jgi:hypothetical protein
MRETGTGQQVAQLLDSYVMMMIDDDEVEVEVISAYVDYN